ncbi:SMP-30/gluconolactonase/LRE family protein [Hafnia psychrotolerans]|uniref:SMP-30/gluconolactonase/LRE family protein n=1 Tax=Hafnia psychrotolerans TaxID=1477018 RepID=UPI0035715129
MFSMATDIRNTLGECPLWCENTRRLYWTNTESSELLALEQDNGVVRRWSLPERPVSGRIFHKLACVFSAYPR